jgi:hypothetical protein
MWQRVFHFFSSLILIVFLVVTIVGLGLAVKMDVYGHFTLCPLDHGKSGYCLMEIVGSITAWQQLFTVTAASGSLALLGVVVAVFWRKIFTRNGRVLAVLAGYKKCGTVSSFFSGYNYLQALLAQGIINPKVYA